MMKQNQCDKTPLLSELVEDRLAENEKTQLESHLETCETCQHELEWLVENDEVAMQVGRHLRDSRTPSDKVLGEVMDRIRTTSCMTNEPVAIQLEDFAVDYLHPSERPDSLGRLGTYEITEVIGSGGMGIVLKGMDTKLNRIVAIKVLSPNFALHSTARKRFTREAQAAAAVGHPNVVTIHSVDEDRLPYLVMEYVDGPSLQARLDHEGFLQLNQILRIGVQVAAGLGAAHAQGLVHRDIKPGNILLEKGIERAKITDFGLARAADDASMTRDGSVVGTPQYMSPEQARGETVDQASDLFSLGSVLYALATGRPPFRAESSYGVMRKITDEIPTPIRELNPEIPEWLSTIVERLMAKRKEERFGSVTELHDLLEQCLSHTQQPTVAKLPNIPKQTKQNLFSPVLKSLLGVIAMVTIATSLIFAFGVPSMFQPDSTPPPEKDPSVYEKEFVVAFSDHDKVGTLNVDIKRGSILVTGYDGDEVVVQLRSPNYSPAGQTSADGFKELRGNTLDFDIEKSSEQIKVDGNSYQYITNLEIKVPRKTNLILDSYQDGKIHVENVEGTFKLRSQNNDISAEKVSGSGRLWSYNGNLSADFKKVTKGQDIELETYNGSIDLTLPADIKANAKYRSGSGRVFTDFEVALAEDRILAAGDSKVEFDEFNRGTINGGGPALTLETEKGDIRLKRRMNISIR